MNHTMVRWMCGVPLKDRRCSVDLYSLLGVQSVADVVRSGIFVVVWTFGAGRKTWGEHVKDDYEIAWVAAWMGNIQECVERLHTWGKRLTLA